jgi:hypothetical protein
MNTKIHPLVQVAVSGLFALVSVAQAQDWKLTSAPSANWISVAASADATRLYSVAGSKSPLPLYWSQDSGAHWLTNTAIPGLWQQVRCSADGTTVGIAGQQLICISTNSGATWISNSIPTPRAIACSADGTRWVAVGSTQVQTSADSGVTWQTNTIPNNVWSALASSSDGLKLALAGWYCPIYVSTNGGSDWIPTSAPSLDWTSVAGSADGTKLVAVAPHTAGTPAAIYTSNNSGSQWTLASALSAQWSSVASSADGTRLLASAPYDGTAQVHQPLYTSTNSGATWNPIAFAGPIWQAVASSGDATKLVAISASGIYTWRAIPSLRLNTLNTNLLLAWPSNSASVGFVLQQSLDLARTNWSDATATPILSNQEFQTVMPPPSGAAFYRLILR